MNLSLDLRLNFLKTSSKMISQTQFKHFFWLRSLLLILHRPCIFKNSCISLIPNLVWKNKNKNKLSVGMTGGFRLGFYNLALANCPNHKSNVSVCWRLTDSQKAPILAICICCFVHSPRRKHATHSTRKGRQQTSLPEPLKSGDGFMQMRHPV